MVRSNEGNDARCRRRAAPSPPPGSECLLATLIELVIAEIHAEFRLDYHNIESDQVVPNQICRAFFNEGLRRSNAMAAKDASPGDGVESAPCSRHGPPAASLGPGPTTWARFSVGLPALKRARTRRGMEALDSVGVLSPSMLSRDVGIVPKEIWGSASRLVSASKGLYR
jgi:hypothetical protein